jgi:hypothetical protein
MNPTPLAGGDRPAPAADCGFVDLLIDHRIDDPVSESRVFSVVTITRQI